MAGPTQHKANPILYSSQEIDNESFNDTYKIKTVADYIFDPAGNAFVPIGAPTTNRIDIAAPLYYLGSAAAGTLESGIGWTITKYDLTTNPYSGKVATNVSWTNRSTGNYQ